MHKKIKTILLIEDDEAIMEVISLILTEDGFNVITDSTGDSVFHSVFPTKIDLALVDLILPQHRGDEIISHIKSDQNLKNVPCIIMSANTEMKVKEIVKEVNADDFILKPFEVKALLLKIHKFV